MSLLTSPTERSKDIILSAYDTGSSRRKTSLRIIKRVLNLAHQRGYADEDSFTSHFHALNENKAQKAMQVTRVTERYLNDLFEFVSADEIDQLSKLGAVSF